MNITKAFLIGIIPFIARAKIITLITVSFNRCYLCSAQGPREQFISVTFEQYFTADDITVPIKKYSKKTKQISEPCGTICDSKNVQGSHTNKLHTLLRYTQ